MADQAGLMDVLKDPNYINANEATKKAIFDKYSAKDKNYTDANDATKSAIRQKFGVDKAEEKPKGMLEEFGQMALEKVKAIPEALSTTVDLKKMLSQPEKQIAEAVTTDVSKKIGAPIVKDVSIDKSKIGSQSLGDYTQKIMQRGGEGALAGAGLAPFTGGGSIVAGGLGGALQGLSESIAADLGLSGDLQEAVGILGPAGAGLVMSKIPQTPQQVNSVLSSDAMNAIKSKLAHKAITKALGMPYWASTITEQIPKAFGKVASQFQSPDYQTVAKELGAKPETIGKSELKFTKQANEELAQQHPDIQPSAKGYADPLYERAKQAYNDAAAEEPFTSSPEFKSLTKDIPAEKTKFSKLFQNTEKEDLVGEDVINNLHYNNPNVSNKDMDRARGAFNEYLKRTTGADHEQIAREANVKQSIAKAKDALPVLFEENDASGIKDELWNLSKEPEGISVFNDELSYYLKNTNVNQARKMWNKIGSNVKDSFKMDDATYKKVTNAIDNAKTSKDIDRATRIMRRFVGPALATSVTNKEKEKQ
jgi:hypothetical protein